MKQTLLLPLSGLAFATVLAAACGGPDVATGEAVSGARIFDPEDPPVPPNLPDPDVDPLPPQLLAPGLEIIQREANRIILRWRDNNDIENGNTIERRLGSSTTFETISNVGTTTLGLHTYVDSAVNPDSAYCYRVKTFNSAATKFSTTLCAWTAAEEPEAVWQLQLRVAVADVDDAGTDDTVRVGLNSMSANEFPHGNRTAMDYARDDFERNSVFTYDLDMAGVSDLADINRLVLEKFGEDELCLRELALIVNEVEVFSREFGNTTSTCHWLHYLPGQSTTLVIEQQELRMHPAWLAYVPQGAPFRIARDVLERRFEGLVGNAFSGSAIEWGHIHGRAVEITQVSTDTFQVDLDLSARVSYLPDPSVDVDIVLQIGFMPSGAVPGTWELHLTTVSSSVVTDYPWYWEAASIVLDPICIPIARIATRDAVWDCASSIESYVENRVENALEPIEEAFNVGDFCTPTVEVQGDGDIQFGCAS